MATPGTYYWQAYRIVSGGADSCIESETRSLTIKAAAPTPKPKPKPVPAPKPKPKPKLKPKPPGALSTARLAGRFKVVERITSVSSFNAKVGSRHGDTWAFVPRCTRGACGAGVVFTPPVSGVPSTRVELARRGAVYAGHGRGYLAECLTEPVSGTIEISLSVKKGMWIGSKWRATRWSGTVLVSLPGTVGLGSCRGGSFTAAISGSLLT